MGLELTRQHIFTAPVQAVPSQASLCPLWHGRLACAGILNILFSYPQTIQRNRILTFYSEVHFRNTANQFLVLMIDI